MLTAMLGEQYVSGLQYGPDPKYLKVLAGCKHFDVHTGPENNNYGWTTGPLGTPPGVAVGLYPIVTFQYSSTTLYQVSYHIRYLFF